MTNIWRNYRLLHVELAALAFVLGLTPLTAVGQKSCPLTEAQSKKAVAAFGKIADFVLNEPRCVNCHGGVNPHIASIGLNPQDPTEPASLKIHGGGVIQKSTNGTIEAECMDCHDHMANKRDGSPTKQWMTAAPFHNFLDKDATTLCRQFKKSLGSAQEFLGHIKDDNGGNNFAQTAFNGDRGLDPDQYLDPAGPNYVAPKQPSISHDAFVKLGQDWISAMGGKFQGDENCGCELTHDKWSGMIHYAIEEKGDDGLKTGPGTSFEWSASSATKVTWSFTNGVGTAQYSVQNAHQYIGWHAASPPSSELRSSSKSTGSGQGTFPATVDVAMSQGNYYVYAQLQLHLAGESVPNNSGNPIIGKQHIETCDSVDGCSGADTADILALPLPPGPPLIGENARSESRFRHHDSEERRAWVF